MSSTILPIHPRTGLRAVGIVGGRPVWPIFGAAPDDDPDGAEDGDGAEPDGDSAQGDADDADAEGDDDAPLGPKGEKALQAEKERRRKEAEKRRAAEAELEKLRNEASKKSDEDQTERIRRDAEQAAMAKANARIVRSEVRAAAAGKLADPKDALTFLDLDQFEVDENGEVDSNEVADAIDDLLKNKPYLAAATAKRFQGGGDGGAARKAGKPKQLTRDDVKRMSPEEIAKAQDEGRLADLLAGK